MPVVAGRVTGAAAASRASARRKAISVYRLLLIRALAQCVARLAPRSAGMLTPRWHRGARRVEKAGASGGEEGAGLAGMAGV